MPEEIGSDLSHLKDLSCSDYGDLRIHKGSWDDTVRLSLAWSGWGKVSAARAATRLLASCLLYTSPSPRDLSTSRMPSSA